MTARSTRHVLVRDLSTRLIAGATATETLMAWCVEHGLSQGPITVDIRQRFSPAMVPDDVLPALEPAPGTTIQYRQVRLLRGSLALATAENWFVPQLLTTAMNDRLQTTDAPFGAVIAPLRPSRRTLAAREWPLTAGSTSHPPRPSGPVHQPAPEIILEHIAVILSGSGATLALVKEQYLSDVIAFAAAPPRWRQAFDGRSRRPVMGNRTPER